jgi:ectoine hydroxylase-related dioxygenase (phytanoyl-CoA dioxygenase family)
LVTAFERLDFHAFHRTDLPRRLAAGNGALAAADPLERIGALAFQLPEGDAYTYQPRPGGVSVVSGHASARTVIEVSREDWEGLVHDLESAPGLLYSGRARCLRGNGMRFVRWEPGLRAMFQGRPIFDPARADLRDLHGALLDVSRAFRLDDDREDMAHFLRTAGYLLVERVFGPEEIDAFRGHAETLRTQAVEGDRNSWWGRNARGEPVLCRVTNAGRIKALAALHRDARLQGLATLADDPLVSRAQHAEDGVSLLIKNPDMTEGLSDLPWHRDCGMGGHACMCPVLVFSIYLSAARPETGELRMLPGSHAGSLGFFDARDPEAPRGVSLAADPGDVSLHYGDIMHAAPPPSGKGPFRECLLLGFARPDAYNHRGLRSYNDQLLSRDDGQVEHLGKVAGRAAEPRRSS